MSNLLDVLLIEDDTIEIMKLNIDRQSISIEDFGELNPVYDNSTLEGRLRNRRVDIIIKKPIM